MMLEREYFEPFIDKEFLLLNANQTVKVQLLEIEDLTPPPAGYENVRQKPFGLMFKGPVEPIIPAEIFQFQDPNGEEFVMSMSLERSEEDGYRYYATFN